MKMLINYIFWEHLMNAQGVRVVLETGVWNHCPNQLQCFVLFVTTLLHVFMDVLQTGRKRKNMWIHVWVGNLIWVVQSGSQV